MLHDIFLQFTDVCCIIFVKCSFLAPLACLIDLLLGIDDFDWLNVCFQDEIPQIPYSELTDLALIGEGGFGDVYRAKHSRLGTVVYEELNAKILGERYSQLASLKLIMTHLQATSQSNYHSGK